MTDESRRRYFPINITVNNSKTTFFKKRRMEINISTDDLSKFKGREKDIVAAFEKFPYNSDICDSEAYRYHLTRNSSDLSKYLN